MMYLGGESWVRYGLIETALGDPPPPPASQPQPKPDTPRVNNGITGDARRSSEALGKMAFDMKVDYAVRQIEGLLGTQAARPR
jgi:hypothetical protein